MDEHILILGIIHAYKVLNSERFNQEEVEMSKSEFFHIAAEVDQYLTRLFE